MGTGAPFTHILIHAGQLDEKYVVVKGGLFEGVTVKKVGDIHIGQGLTKHHVQPIPDKVIPGWGNPVAEDKNTIGQARTLREILGPERVAANNAVRQQRAAASGA
jgi:hypothetical protein